MRALLDGWMLRCPRCREGAMFRTFFEIHERCPACRVEFQPNEGDFLGSIVVLYGVTAVLTMVLFCIVHAVVSLSIMTHIYIWSVFQFLFMVAFFRNLKGFWVGLLYLATGLKRI